MNKQEITLLDHVAKIENKELRNAIEDQANFYIGWHYDYLVRCELDNSNSKQINKEQREQLKQQAIMAYIASNENYLRDMKAEA